MKQLMREQASQIQCTLHHEHQCKILEICHRSCEFVRMGEPSRWQLGVTSLLLTRKILLAAWRGRMEGQTGARALLAGAMLLGPLCTALAQRSGLY